ncbi:MAG TPA: hypothetical protein V6D50_22235 [Chroococcales cyanobacterium]|jgi:hypothetical protein
MNINSVDSLIMLTTLASAVICISLPRVLMSIQSNLTRKSWEISSDRTVPSPSEFVQPEASLN